MRRVLPEAPAAFEIAAAASSTTWRLCGCAAISRRRGKGSRVSLEARGCAQSDFAGYIVAWWNGASRLASEPGDAKAHAEKGQVVSPFWWAVIARIIGLSWTSIDEKASRDGRYRRGPHVSHHQRELPGEQV